MSHLENLVGDGVLVAQFRPISHDFGVWDVGGFFHRKQRVLIAVILKILEIRDVVYVYLERCRLEQVQSSGAFSMVVV